MLKRKIRLIKKDTTTDKETVVAQSPNDSTAFAKMNILCAHLNEKAIAEAQEYIYRLEVK